MAGFRLIVVGVSEDAPTQTGAALALALRLRDPENGTLLLATVIDALPDRRHLFASTLAPESLIAEAEATLARARMQLPAEIPVKTRVLADPSTARGLRDLAAGVAADLLVLGPTGRHRVGAAAGAAMGQRLLRRVPCPVAVAGMVPEVWEREPLICVVDDGTPAAKAALSCAWEVAVHLGARVQLLGVIEVRSVLDLADDREDEVRERLKAAVAAAPSGVMASARTVVCRHTGDALLDAAANAVLVVGGVGNDVYLPRRGIASRLAANRARSVLLVPFRPTSTPEAGRRVTRSDGAS